MKRLKITLRSNNFYIISFLLLFFYILLFTKIINYHSKYKDGNITISGRTANISIKNDKISFIIYSKEKIKATYYLKGDEIVDIQDGDYLTIKGIINTPKNNTIFNNFNYQQYLYNNKIYKIIIVKNISYQKRSSNPFVKLKNSIIKRARVNKYLDLFITGDKSLLESDIYDSFKNVGVAHLLAISGMHISIFISILKKLLKYVSDNIQNRIIILFLLFYAYIIGFPPSVMRVILCYVIGIINKKTNLNVDILKVLYLSAVILIIINPFIIYHLGFIFSYLTSIGIILSKKYYVKNYFLNIIIMTIFAMLFTLPVLININFEINIITIIANLLMVPLISFIIFPFSLITFIFPFLLKIYVHITLLNEKMVIGIDKINFFTVIIPKMNILIILLYYFFLILFVYYGYKKYLVIIISIIFLNKGIYLLDSSYRILFFDVNQGDNSIIIYPHQKKTILIDTGGLTNKNYQVSDNIITYLKSVGISNISFEVLTHGDFDHMGEAINLVKTFKVEKVIFNCGPYNDLENELIKVLEKKKIKYYSCIKKLNIDKNKLYFLQTKEYDNENDNSNVIYTELNGYKFMFMGDASITTEKEILDKYNLTNIDVLKVGHHGSKTSSGKEFINKINPKYSIISVGKNNRYGHPNKEVLKILDNSKIYRTDQDGSIMFKIKNIKLKIETCSP